MEGGLVEIGTIVGAIGLKGEFKVAVVEPRLSCLLIARKLFIRGKTMCEFNVIGARLGRGTVIMKVESVKDRNGAEALRGRAVLVDFNVLPPLPDGEYYMCQLEGAKVCNVSGKGIGSIVALSTNGAQDLLVIDTPGEGEVLVPFVKGIVVSVDTKNKLVVLDPPEGLFAR